MACITVDLAVIFSSYGAVYSTSSLLAITLILLRSVIS